MQRIGDTIRRYTAWAGGAVVYLLLAAVLVGAGVMWIKSTIPNTPPEKLPAKQNWTAEVVNTIPHKASLPWVRDVSSPQPVALAAAQLPWVRDVSNPHPVGLAPARLPWMHSADHPAAVALPVAKVPVWKKAR